MSTPEPTTPDDDLTSIAVIGMACRVPGAESASEFWELLRSGREPLETVPPEELERAGLTRLLDEPGFVAKRKPAADPALFDGAHFGLTPAESAATDPQQRYLLEMSVRALEDAAIDPSRYPGDIGVYVGMNHSDYLMRHVLPERSAIRALGWHRVLMGNDRGFTATQISYRLGLRGPSIAVDCACSSGLAAVHQACRALLDYDTDTALAGAAAVAPTNLGYHHEEGGISSPDGRCRPFSAQADGTVFASGAVMFVLKRWEDARADGDRIHAVIRASALNNDGSRKSGYTAPSVDGQAELISRVHRLAGVAAEEIGYVEAHGTGTALGDPIEVAALTEAFRASGMGRGDCGLGSVKSAIGHLDAASGAAGLAKVVLALRHRHLPATLHAEEPNPHIDFESSPFSLVTEGRPWTRRLLAGVSSFGVGGTNAHLLVGAAPDEEARVEPRPTTVALPFTARTDSALDELHTALLERIEGAGPAEVLDVAHTLTRSRLGQARRRALVWRTGSTPAVIVSAGTSDRGAALRLRAGRVGPHPEAAAEAARYGPHPSDAAAALAWAAVWNRWGVRAVAVISDGRTRLAAAVLCGLLTDDEAARLLTVQTAGGDPRALIDALPRRRATLPWYAESGDQHCAPGEVPDLTAVLTGDPLPGRRTLPPLVDAVVSVVPGPTGPPLPHGLFPFALEIDPVDVGEDLAAAVTAAWVVGVLPEPAPVAPGGRIVDVPGHPFDRIRHWIDPVPRTAADPETEVAAAATTEAELLERARGVVGAALGRHDLAPTDSLFAEGGDSLAALRVVALARSTFGISVRLGSFMADPTARNLADLVIQATGTRPSTSGPAHEVIDAPSGPLPLTALQQRFHFLAQLPGAAEAYHVPVLADLRGRLDVEALGAAVGDVVSRHESLRLSVRDTETGPVQEITAVGTVPVPVVEPGSDAELQELIRELLGTSIPLDSPPPLLARVARMGPERHVLIVVLHHLVADARSTGVFLADLYACYAERIGGAPADLAPIDGLFARHVQTENAWLSTPDAHAQRQYWVDTLRGAPDVLELPTDRPRGADRAFRGGRRSFSLPPGTGTALRLLAAEEGTTPFAVLLAAFTAFLCRVSGAPEVVVGVPVSGRHRPDAEHLIGNFVNTLPLRLSAAGGEDFRTVVRRVTSVQRAALDHQDVPFEVVARALHGPRNPATTPVFQVLFNMLDTASSRPDAGPGLEVEPVPFDMAGSPMDFQLDWWLTADGGVAARVLHAEVFDQSTVAAWQQILRTLVREVLADPNRPLHAVRVEPPSARAAAARALTGPTAADVDESAVHARVVDVARRLPERLAVTDGETALNYVDLVDLAGGVAAELIEHGVSTGEPVLVAMRRGTPLVVAVLGVLRAGATPVPVELNHPDRRIAAIVADCAARVACTDAAGRRHASGLAVVEVSDLHTRPRRSGQAPGDDVPGGVGAYLTYTSGTTGQPKGIHFPHRALTHLIHWESAGYSRDVRFLQLASFGFDAAFHEMFAALCAGGSLHVASEEVKHDHDLLLAFIAEHRVQKAILPVSLLHALAARPASDRTALATLREIASTGEQLRIGDRIVELFAALPDCTLINNYGPAETHVVTSYRFAGPPADWPRWAPIGTPIPGVALRIVDRDGNDVPRGSIGELVICGPCVATGYPGRAELTAQRFVPAGPEGARAYRSGDRARLLRSGAVELLGRADQQVKIRGFRVELGEIEVALRRDPALRDVAIVAGDAADGDRALHAYLVLDADETTEPAITRIRAALRTELPAYMVPRTFTRVDALPVNANGKVDPARLPAPEGTESAPPHSARPGTPEGRVLAAFREVLRRPELGPEDDFFDVGGHSLLATTLVHRLRTEFGTTLPMVEFFDAGTPRAVTEALGRSAIDGQAIELPQATIPVSLPPGLAWLATETPAPQHQKSFVYEVSTGLDPDRLQAAVAELARRHPALRLRLRTDPAPQLITVDTPPQLDVVGAIDDETLTHLPDRLLRKSLDLRHDAPVRFTLATRPDGHSILGMTVHRLVLDGRSQLVLLADLDKAYLDGPGRLGPEDDGFLRYLNWRADPEPATTTAALDWLRAHGTALDAPRHEPGVPDRAVWRSGRPLHAALRQACADQRTTAFTWHLTAFALAIETLGDAVLPGRCVIPMDGRPVGTLDATIGGFATIAPLRLGLDGATTPAEAFTTMRPLADAVRAVRAVPLADPANTEDREVDPQLVFSFQRSEQDTVTFAGARCSAVGPDRLDEDQLVSLTVLDSDDQVTVVVKSALPAVSAEDLLARHRRALHHLTFDPDAPTPVLEATA
ncbi:non-ribosomal peptide synthetase [Actinoalloteichus hymeniacidonis]|uniref:Amino acid adenylation enzyme/thioester reductase family protein n=1 Tax=Actinoalloteichus hymeniacidonis TaxID=340345 RepID=A0AAC9HQL9_9PSEU|nr:non-ribosomal peptide synthetase [Actinoalloteichus hymeniacidonis]AOS63787.1 amino acid adenylation enzyme/thioester reductase family protein [Actinoalloteichus hymeniacidonis]MBB5908159.1 amino acid adenylation domain-containing protein [Actinoalloteichus hymeniacidonis]